MSGNNRIIQVTVNAAIFIVLEIAALSMLRNNGALQDTWISKGFHAFYATVWGGTEEIKHYFSLKKENDALAQENFRLAQKVRYYESISASHAQVNACGQAPVPEDSTGAGIIGKFSYIPATISKISNNRQHNYIILDKGSEDGILPQSGVITENGVIGIVDAVSRHYSYAISFKSPGVIVSTRIGKTGPVGSLSWDGITEKGALLNEIPHHIQIEKGDTVFTSGFSSIFPPDIPLGTVGNSRLVNGATYEIQISLFEDFLALRYVTIVHNTGKEEINGLVSRQ